MLITELVDIKSFLSHHGISYSTSGKNLSGSGEWISIQICPWCNKGGGHFGIHIGTKICSCWACGARGKNIIKFVSLILNCSYKEAINLLQVFQTGENIPTFTKQKKSYNTILNLPDEAKELDQSHRNYLISRNYDPDFLIKKYKIKGTSFLGKWAWRIIIPVYEQGRLVSFTSRDITNLSLERYKSCPASLEVINIKDCLYNRETAQSVGVVVEGVFDSWRLNKFGWGAMAIFGTAYSTQQLMKLKGISRLFVFFDSEEKAQEQAKKFAYDAGIYVPEVIILNIPEYKDPDSMPDNEVKILRKELFGKIY